MTSQLALAAPQSTRELSGFGNGFALSKLYFLMEVITA